MKIRTVDDAASALSCSVKPLRNAANFADLIIAQNTFEVPVTGLWHLAAACRNFEDRIIQMACDLRKLDVQLLCKRDGKAIEALLEHPDFNVYKVSNSLQGAVARYSALKSSSEKMRTLRGTMKSVPGFQKSADDAFQVFLRITDIVTKYTEGRHGSHCTLASDKHSSRMDSDALTNVAQRGTRYSSALVRKGRDAERRVTFSTREPHVISDSADKENRRALASGKENMRRSTSQRRASSSSRRPDFNVFISHCGRDKYTMAIPLHDKLKAKDITSFVDKESLVIGEKSADAMMQAMETASVLVFIVSAQAAARKWPMRELRCFLKRQEEAKRRGERGPIVIPVFYRMTVDECTGDDLFNIESSTSHGTVFRKEGFYKRVETGEASMRKVRAILKELSTITGIENDEGATNSDTKRAKARREGLLGRIVKAVVAAVDRV